MLRPSRPAVLIALLSVGLVHPTTAQTRTERVQSLAGFAIPIRSIDPTDEDFSDLEPLRDRIGSASVVLLGEQTHGDGATFLAKSRLIRFLHQELGFDVLAFESGFYECERAESLIRIGESVRSAIEQCVFSLWTRSAQVAPTVDYLAETRSGSRPIRLAGFDSQFTAPASQNHLFEELRVVADEIGASFDWDLLGIALNSINRRVGSLPPAGPDEGIRQKLDGALAELARELQASDADGSGFWAQTVWSLRSNVLSGLMVPADRMSLVLARDQQMAENLLWHLEHNFPDRKVIVWAASAHNARRLDTITGLPRQMAEMYRRWRPMGEFLDQRLGPEMYSIAFIAQEGTWGILQNPRQIEPGGPETLEAMLADAGLEYGFVDLRQLPPALRWLEDEFESRPFGYSAMKAKWGEVVDGFFFTRVMSPSTRLTP